MVRANIEPFLVTKERLPLLYDVCDAISHDGGGRAGHKAYAIPNLLPLTASAIETALGELSPEDRLDFAIGEQHTMQEIAGRNKTLTAAHHIIGNWFNEGSRCGCHALPVNEEG